jgi:hypothetical protein
VRTFAHFFEGRLAMNINLKLAFADWLKFDQIHECLVKLTEGVNKMAGELDALKVQVAKNTDVIESALTLIDGIKAALDAAIAANDPAALQALSDTLAAEDQKLADAVAKNTPAQP